LASDLSILHSGAPVSDFIASKEYLNFFRNRQDITAMELLLIEAPQVPFLAPGETAGAYLLRNTDAILSTIRGILQGNVNLEIAHDFGQLNEFFSTLDYLANLPTARL